MTGIFAPFARLARDVRGSSMIEFALVAPIFFMFLFGIFDVAYAGYTRSVLEGAMEAAARNSGLEAGATSTSAIDSYVRNAVNGVNGGATVTFERLNYRDFSDVGTPEDFTDANGNAAYDANECFTDANANGVWDSDVGATGLGGADDVVAYTATVEYDSIFPAWKLLNLHNKNNYFQARQELVTTTVLRNQPFANQSARPTTLVCP